MFDGCYNVSKKFILSQIKHYLQMSSIKDNYKKGSVGQFLAENIKPEADVSIVSAYFTIYAYHKLKEELDQIHQLRFLFGEPRFIKSLDPEKNNKRDFKIEDDKLVIPTESRLSQKAIARACAAWIQDKVAIKSMVKPNFLHGKLYHLDNPNGVQEAIMGSSNFTVNGLGFGGTPNIELNMVIQDRRDLTDLKLWFDELWDDKTGLVEDVKAEVLTYLEKLYVENDPEFIYFKTLFHIFENYVNEHERGGLLNERIGFFESEIWDKLYKFQQDGAKGAINKILKHNGCIIADSVGLGKTYEALAVIKYFELLNQRVLVLCPKKLAENWTVYQASQNNELNPFIKDRFGYAVLHHTDLGRKSGKSSANSINLENFNWGAYDLVVIDESHNFRGNPMDKTKDDGEVKMNRPKWLMEKIIKSGTKTKVLLLSATPVNNNLRDLRNQIYLITEGRNDALFASSQIKDIGNALKTAQTQFTNWADPKKNKERTVKQLLERLDSAFFKLLDELTIARSRKHIKNFYKKEMVEIGKFPDRLKPKSIYPDIDLKKRFPSYDDINKQILAYKLSIFNPSAYVFEDKKNKYGIKTDEQIAQAKTEKAEKEKQKKAKKNAKNGAIEEKTEPSTGFNQSDREHFLIGMMKVNYLKRLESSIKSFSISMERTIKKIEDLEQEIDKFVQSKANSKVINLENVVPDDPSDDEDAETVAAKEEILWQVGTKLKFDLADIDLEEWLADLKKDKMALNNLHVNAFAVSADRDAKLSELKKLIAEKIKTPLNKGNKKVIVFTAYADTATYIYDELKTWVQTTLKLNIALVAGSATQTTFGTNNFSHILTNFSPIAKKRSALKTMPQTDEIDILIATDCISEGQNLQDADYLVNYDIHWNPVRIIQRFGRIDRLGSKNDCILLVNFWPTKDLDQYMNLKERVESRMALVDVTATNEDNILSVDQIEDLIEDDLKYRNKQLKKLQEEVLDLEDMDDSVDFSDFTLDDFRIELLNFIQSNRRKLEDAPLGLYAVVPSPSGAYSRYLDVNAFNSTEKEIIKPGVVYCLKQKGDTEGHEEINPLQPYFLVYIREDGTVRFNYTHAKQILEMFRLMCQGRTKPFEDLCDVFSNETKNGDDMEKYSDLVKLAIDEISRVFKKRAHLQLMSGRGGLLIPQSKQASDMDNFELVTWLIIK